MAALVYVSDPDAVRGVSELDVHNLDTTVDVRIEATLGLFGTELEQRFFDQLEYWIPRPRQLFLRQTIDPRFEKTQ